MRHIAGFAAYALCLPLIAHAQDAPTAAASRSVIIRAQALIDGTSAAARFNQEIVIRGNHIVDVRTRGAQPAPPGRSSSIWALQPSCPDSSTTHTHIFLQGEVPAAGGYDVQLLKFPASFRAARATVSARRALEQGFTTIRDVETEGAGYGDVGIKQAINEGYIPGPRMFVSTRAISSTGGYSLGRLRAGDHRSQGRAAHRRPGRGAQGRA